jgi:hypothetical protein
MLKSVVKMNVSFKLDGSTLMEALDLLYSAHMYGTTPR